MIMFHYYNVLYQHAHFVFLPGRIQDRELMHIPTKVGKIRAIREIPNSVSKQTFRYQEYTG